MGKTVGQGVVAMLVGPMGELVVLPGLQENGHKRERVLGGGFYPVLGREFPGGAVNRGEGIIHAIRREVGEEVSGLFSSIVWENDRLRRLPGITRVEQVRDDGFMGFLVVVFALRLAESEVLRGVSELGLELLQPGMPLRPRDAHLLKIYGAEV